VAAVERGTSPRRSPKRRHRARAYNLNAGLLQHRFEQPTP
jgi:hypothetical protein